MKINFNLKDFEIRKYKKRIFNIRKYEEDIKYLSDEELTSKFNSLKEEYLSNGLRKNYLIEFENKILAIACEVFRRNMNINIFDVQLIGAMIMNDGNIAELKTGEGKTYVAVLLSILKNSKSESVHIITANEYLAKRDFIETENIFKYLNIESSYINSTFETKTKLENYKKDVVYIYAQELGFDYLRSNLALKKNEKCLFQENMINAIIDEIDYVLIDEAKTPIILSTTNNSEDDIETYIKADNFVKSIVGKEDMYTIDIENDVALLTEMGVAYAEDYFNIDNYSDIDFIEMRHAIHQSMYAYFRMNKNDSYIVDGDRIILIDLSTGRLANSKVFSDGLHQAIQAKENVSITPQNKILGKITYPNLFRLYKFMTGMSGTIKTDEIEFNKNYNKNVFVVPTNKEIKRIDKSDYIYATREQKLNSVVKSIVESNAKGQPVLVGTDSVSTSEELSKLLSIKNIEHKVLNAKNHEEESQIIALAGQKGAVTISTNMAGRGTDIKLSEESKNAGGLKVIGTYRNDNRRIDNQLRGRSGRQGDIGESEFYVSLEDELVKGFAPKELKDIMKKHQDKAEEEGKTFSSLSILSKQIEKAQMKKEGMNFERRLYNYQYDSILNNERVIIYNERDKVLNEENINEMFLPIVEFTKNYILEEYFKNKESSSLLSKDDVESILSQINKEWRYELDINIKPMTAEELKIGIFKILDIVAIHSDIEVFGIKSDEYKKICVLYSIDKYWTKHLYDLKNLEILIKFKDNPLYEYEKDSLALFNNLIDNIKIESVFTYLRNLKNSMNADNVKDNENKKR